MKVLLEGGADVGRIPLFSVLGIRVLYNCLCPMAGSRALSPEMVVSGRSRSAMHTGGMQFCFMNGVEGGVTDVCMLRVDS